MIIDFPPIDARTTTSISGQAQLCALAGVGSIFDDRLALCEQITSFDLLIKRLQKTVVCADCRRSRLPATPEQFRQTCTALRQD
ncbi:MAG: hypothetical protein IKE42_06385 [Aquamicrobium sp.]|uniref:hypothetical protein n=1 Tax=Mesorhizobium sp. Pch-S TaxID=2082387 RepID=UPI001013C24E|nr:hypothetical protein [Mesorhizobium sp. Pch-S]MBR2687462.1 hypothetical protein [Aquamicrobium sp.]